jgi:hypothetical protein
MERYPYDLSHECWTAGKLGRILPIDIIPIIPNDTMTLSITGALRINPLRRFLVMDCHYHLAAYYCKHRHVDDNFVDAIKSGMQYDSAGGSALATITHTTSGDWNYLPLTPPSGTIPAHLVRHYNNIVNFYYIIRNTTAPYDLDDKPSSADERNWGKIAARLPEYWNTGLTDTAYGSAAYTDIDVSGGDLNLLELIQQQGLYRSEVERDWYDLRYKDLLKGGFGAEGINIDIDQRPELLGVSEGFLSGNDVDHTDTTYTGKSVGKSVGVINLNIPPKRFNENGAIYLILLVRYPSVLQDAEHYLHNRTMEYEEFSGDPRILATTPPHELNKDDFCHNTTGGTDSWGWHPYGNWFRTHPSVTHPKLSGIVGMPFIPGNLITDDEERQYDTILWGLTDYFASVTDLGGGHYTLCADIDVKSQRVVPPASYSIYAGSHVDSGK